MMALLKGIFMSMAGPAPNYDMQKILSCKSPKEAAMMSGSVSVEMCIRDRSYVECGKQWYELSARRCHLVW